MKTLFSVGRTVYAALIFCVLLLPCSAVRGQQKNDLIAKLKASSKADSSRVKILFELAGEYIQSNLDSMEYFAKEGLAIAEKVNFERGIARCAQLMGLVNIRRHDYEKALQYYNTARKIYEKTHDQTMEAEVLVYMGDIYYRDSKYNLALEHYRKAVDLDEITGDLKTQGLALIDIGGIYMDQGNYTESIKYYLKGLKVFEKLGDNQGISMTLVNIANVHAMLGNYKPALEYVNKSLAITHDITDKEVVFSNMVNIGVIYGQIKDYKSALAAFKNGIVIADSLGDRAWINACLTNIADIYYQMGEYDTSLEKYTILLKQNEELKDTTFIITAKTGIGNNLVKKGKLQQGIYELQAALKMSQEKQLRQTIFDIAHSLSEAYEQSHDYANALKYHKIYFDYRDSLNSEKNDKRIQQLQFDYELDKKEAQIELLNKNKIIAQHSSDRQRIMIWTALSGLVLVIIICVLLYRNSQRERLDREEISRQKNEIEAQAARLTELNKFKDKTFSVLSHDLRAPVGALTATMAMMDQNIITPEEFLKLKPDVQNQLSSLNMLLDNLLNWAKGYMQGEFTEQKELIDISQMVNTNISVLEDVAGRKKLRLINKIAPATTITGNAGQIDIVVRNVVMNAIKFSNNDGAITFTSQREGDKVTVNITDEGVGMTPEQLNKLFTAASGNSTYGTGGEKGVGLGLLLCYEFIRANNGTILATSEVNKGTTFSISLPAGTQV